jgi:quinohemoprotein amine dehydrogenase
MRRPKLDGEWAVKGYQPGKGPIFGRVTIRETGPGTYTTQSAATYARDNRSVTREGQAIVYTGFQWRGRSMDAGATPPAGDAALSTPAADVPTDWREVLFIDKDGQHADGRWFTGAQDEFGADVQLQRIGSDPILLGVAQPMLKTGATGQELRIFGVNLPSGISAADVSLGPGVTVDRVVGSAGDQMTLAVSVAADAPTGQRNVLVTGARGDASVAVYSKIDFIKVLPESGLARVGGVTVPKQFEQFEARAYTNGLDDKPGTADDVELGPVDVNWSVEEYTATYHDDDKDFVGAINENTGLFTPNIEGPNPKRQNGTNNIGDVWVVATYLRQDAAGDNVPLKARAHLLVSPPLYIRWFNDAGGQ